MLRFFNVCLRFCAFCVFCIVFWSCVDFVCFEKVLLFFGCVFDGLLKVWYCFVVCAFTDFWIVFYRIYRLCYVLVVMCYGLCRSLNVLYCFRLTVIYNVFKVAVFLIVCFVFVVGCLFLMAFIGLICCQCLVFWFFFVFYIVLVFVCFWMVLLVC